MHSSYAGEASGADETIFFGFAGIRREMMVMLRRKRDLALRDDAKSLFLLLEKL